MDFMVISSCLTYFLLISNFVGSSTITTCCKYQSVLNLGTGQCEAHPSYEFEYDIFLPEWKIPTAFSENGEELETLRLVERAPWCKCTAAKEISLQFGKELGNKNDTRTWILETDQNTYLTADGRLFMNDNYISSEEFCLNKFHEIQNVDPDRSQDKLSLEFIQCHETCMKAVLAPTELISKESLLTKMDWMRTAFCEDLEEAFTQLEKVKGPESYEADDITPLCKKWTPFYYQDDNFYLITSVLNKTRAIQDSTYPWGSLPSNTFCKVRNSESSSEADDDDNETGKLLKFCLPEIKKLFYTYQEIYAILAGISAAFLLFNLAIYFSLRNNLSISGWTEFFYSLSLFAYFGFSIVGVLFVPEGEDVGLSCYIIGLLIQYFELANGTTLVALSLDLFWTFCKFDSDGYTDDPKVSKMRLFFYVIFSLFFPMGIVTYGTIKNKRLLADQYLGGTPHYGLLHCTSPSWQLASVTQFAMQGANLFLALISAYIILNKKNRSRRVFKFDEDNDHILDPDRLDIFSKLLLFVFAFWLINFMEFFYQGEIFTKSWHLVAFHIANYSQGIFAFVILICNRRTLRGLVNRDWNLKSLFRHACCTCGSGDGVSNSDREIIEEEAMPLSPLMKKMKTGSIRRSTVRGNAFY